MSRAQKAGPTKLIVDEYERLKEQYGYRLHRLNSNIKRKISSSMSDNMDSRIDIPDDDSDENLHCQHCKEWIPKRIISMHWKACEFAPTSRINYRDKQKKSQHSQHQRLVKGRLTGLHNVREKAAFKQYVDSNTYYEAEERRYRKYTPNRNHKYYRVRERREYRKPSKGCIKYSKYYTSGLKKSIGKYDGDQARMKKNPSSSKIEAIKSKMPSEYLNKQNNQRVMLNSMHSNRMGSKPMASRITHCELKKKMGTVAQQRRHLEQNDIRTNKIKDETKYNQRTGKSKQGSHLRETQEKQKRSWRERVSKERVYDAECSRYEYFLPNYLYFPDSNDYQMGAESNQRRHRGQHTHQNNVYRIPRQYNHENLEPPIINIRPRARRYPNGRPHNENRRHYPRPNPNNVINFVSQTLNEQFSLMNNHMSMMSNIFENFSNFVNINPFGGENNYSDSDDYTDSEEEYSESDYYEVYFYESSSEYGLEAMYLNALPVHNFNSSKYGSHQCTICLVELKDKDYCKRLPCEHIFHAECIDEWLRRKSACPVCRDPIRFMPND